MTLTDRAVEELAHIGMTPDSENDVVPVIVASIVQLVQTFESQGLDGEIIDSVLGMFVPLAKGDLLAPLGSDIEEWDDVSATFGGMPTWRAKRDPSAVSHDAGVTWTTLNLPEVPKTG